MYYTIIKTNNIENNIFNTMIIFYQPANFPKGILFIIFAAFAGSDHAFLPISVNTTVGFTLFVLMLCGPNSNAIVLVIWFTAPLDAQYVTWSRVAV